jgi:hypothetical protein
MQKQEAWAELGTELRRERLELQQRMAGQEDAPQTAPEARQRPEAEAGITAAPAPEPRTTEPQQRPAEVIYSIPTRPLEQEAAAETTARENTDARQSTTAEHAEMSDAKTARLASLERTRGGTEADIATGLDRGSGHSR